MFRWLRFDILIPLIFIIGVSQYAGTALNQASQGDVALWQLDSSALEGAGPARYVKDGFLLLMAVIWPILIFRVKHSRQIARLLSGYSLWVTVATGFGLVGFLVGYSPSLFLTAGLRWVMLLHAAVGVFFALRAFPSRLVKHRQILNWILLLAIMDLILVAWQLRAGVAIFGVGIGQSRLTGFFSNAGVAGFFGLGLALIALVLDGGSIKLRVVLSVMALLIALSSGTRSMMMAVFLIVFLQMFELADRGSSRRFRDILKLSLIPMLGASIWIGYQQMISVVNRGGILEAQLDSGGRISNFLNMIDVISRSDTGEFLFGRGLGLGTNTAYGILTASGVPPDIFRFNWLVDNSFITQFFQFGFLGSLIFWGGVFSFIFFMRPVGNKLYGRRYWLISGIFFLILWAGNPFEQYFLMMPFAIAWGCTYWSWRANVDRLPQATVGRIF